MVDIARKFFALALVSLALASCPGLDGPRGLPGPDGADWLTGMVDPIDALGDEGDYYLNIASATIFAKAGGAWVLVGSMRPEAGVTGAESAIVTVGPEGLAVPPGSRWITGAGAPAADLAAEGGAAGSLYLDTADGRLYQREGGQWLYRLSMGGGGGPDDAAWTSDWGLPAPASGKEGDFWLDTGSSRVYRKGPSGWASLLRLLPVLFDAAPLRIPYQGASAPAIAASGDLSLVMTSAGILRRGPGTGWTLDAQTSSTFYLYACVTNGTRYVGVAQDGIYTSDDGIGWTRRLELSYYYSTSLAWGNGYFLLITNGSILKSSDGIAWTRHYARGLSGTSLAFGNGTWVAEGAYNELFSSADGVTWTKRLDAGTNYIQTVRYLNTLFVAVANTSIYTSPNGTTWTARTNPSGNSLSVLHYGAGRYLAAGYGALLSSPDGATWTNYAASTTDNYGDLAVGNGLLVAVGSTTYRTSTNGTTWTASAAYPAGASGYPWFSHGYFWLRGSKGTLLRSANFAAWTSVPIPIENVYTRFIAGGLTILNSYSASCSTLDGASWQTLTLGTPAGGPAIAFGGRFVAARGEIIYSSPDGEHWTVPESRPSISSIRTLSYLGGRYIALGSGGLASSADGLNWTTSATILTCVAFGNGVWMGANTNGTFALSPDGSTWTGGTLPGSPYVTAIEFGNGVFVVLCGSSAVSCLVSSDGTAWESASIASADALQYLEFADGRFVAMSSRGWIASSADGRRWEALCLPGSYSFRSLAYGDGRFCAIGHASPYSLVATSLDGRIWSYDFGVNLDLGYYGPLSANGRLYVY